MSERIITYKLEVPESNWRKFTDSFPRSVSIMKKLNQMIQDEYK